MSDTAQAGYLGLARQAAQGTGVAPTRFSRATSIDLGPTTDVMLPDAEIGGSRDIDSAGAQLGGVRIGGGIEAYLRTRDLGLLLLGLGYTASAPSQEGTVGAWQHGFTPGAPTLLTLETSWGADRAVRRFVDCLVNELTLSVEAGGYATLGADIIGQGEAWQTVAAAETFETDPIATYLGSAITFDGLGTYRMASQSVTIANNVTDDEWVIGKRTLDDLTMRRREVTGSATMRVGNNTPNVTELYRAFAYGTKTATGFAAGEPYHTSATLTFGSPRLIGTSATNRFRWIVTIPDIVLTAVPLDSSGDDVITVDLEWQAVKGAGNIADITVWNAMGTAYTAA